MIVVYGMRKAHTCTADLSSKSSSPKACYTHGFHLVVQHSECYLVQAADAQYHQYIAVPAATTIAAAAAAVAIVSCIS
jgi:hypothetical protein